jgi:hypothetical protein
MIVTFTARLSSVLYNERYENMYKMWDRETH